MSLSVAIIGASHKSHRFAYKAQQMLMQRGHTVFPVSANGRSILDVPGYSSVKDIPQTVDTVTLYVNPQRHQPLLDDILAIKPRRIIFNPGTESAALIHTYEDAGIQAMEACTLVMLQTDQF